MHWANRIAQAIADRQFKRGNISRENIPIITFGYVVLFDIITALLTVTVTGAVLGCTWQAIFYGIAFIPLRIYAGGFHFENTFVCLSVSTVIDVTAVVVIANASSIPLTALLVCLFPAVAVIWLLSPIETPNKPLDEMERKVYGRRSKIISGLYFIVAVFLYFVGASSFAAAICTATTYVALLVLVGNAKNNLSSRKTKNK